MTEITVEKTSEGAIKKQSQHEGEKGTSLKESYGITLEEFFYLLFFWVMFGIRSIGFHEGQIAYNVAIVIGMCCWVCKVAMTKHTLSENILIFSLMTVAVIAYLNSGEKGLLFDFAMMLGMKGVSSKRVIKLATAILTPAMIVLTFLTISGLMNCNYWPAQRPFIGLVFRSSFGYPHPNTAQTTMFLLYVMLFFLMSKKQKAGLNIHFQIQMFVFSVYYFLYTQSKTGILMFFLLLIIYYIIRGMKKTSNAVKFILIFIYPIFYLAVFGISIFGYRVITPQLRSVSIFDRIYLAGYYLSHNSFSLFGQRLCNPGQEMFGIDISPIYLLVNYGVVAFIIMLVIWPVVMREFLIHNDLPEIEIAIVFFIMGLSDPFFYNLSFKNILFIFAGEKIFSLLENIDCKKRNLWAKSFIPTHSKKIFKNVHEYCSLLKSSRGKMSFENFNTELKITELVFVIIFLICSSAMIFRSDLIYTDVQIYQPVSLTSSELLSEQRKGNIIIGNTRVNKKTSDSYMMCIIADRWSKNIPNSALMTNVMVKLEALKLALSISLGISLLLGGTLILIHCRKSYIKLLDNLK